MAEESRFAAKRPFLIIKDHTVFAVFRKIKALGRKSRQKSTEIERNRPETSRNAHFSGPDGAGSDPAAAVTSPLTRKPN